MKVGLYITTQFTPETDVSAARKEMLEQVRAARQNGFCFAVGAASLCNAADADARADPDARLSPARGRGHGDRPEYPGHAAAQSDPRRRRCGDARSALGRPLRSRRRHRLSRGGVQRLRCAAQGACGAFQRKHRSHAPTVDRGSRHAPGQDLQDRRPRHWAQAAAAGRPADLGCRRGRCCGQARRAHRRCVADHELRASRACWCRR